MDIDSAEFAVDEAMKSGARFADARVEKTVYNGFLMKNGVPQVSAFEDAVGLGIRVFIGRTLGFAATNDISPKGMKKAVDAAIRDARNAAFIGNDVSLTMEKTSRAKYRVDEKKKA